MKHITKCFFYIRNEEELSALRLLKNVEPWDTVVIARLNDSPKMEGFVFIITSDQSLVNINKRYLKETIPEFVEKYRLFLESILRESNVTVQGSDVNYTELMKLLKGVN